MSKIKIKATGQIIEIKEYSRIIIDEENEEIRELGLNEIEFIEEKKKYKYLFCDLDGTLIETISRKTFPEGIWDMKLRFDVLDIIKKLNPKEIFIVTNQGGVEKGFVSESSIEAKCHFICRCIEDYCGITTKFQFCTSNNKDNLYRKPNIGMLNSFFYYNLSSKEEYLMIGDASGLEGQFSDSDKKTAENFGIDYMDVNEFVRRYS